MTLKRARTFAATLTVAALVALGAAGCGSGGNDAEIQGGGDPATGENNAPADAKGAVALAAEKTNQQSYRMTMTMEPEMTMEAVVDPVTKNGRTTMTVNAEGMSMETEMILIGEDIYMKTSGGPLDGDKWMHMKSAALGEAFSASQVDPAEFLKNADGVTQVDEFTYKGVLDLSETSASAFGGGMGEKFGADFTEIPFTLTLDSEGRLSRMETTMKGMGGDGTDRTAVVTMSDYGLDVDVTAPPADQVEEMPGFGE